MKHQAGLQKELSAPRTVLSPGCWTPTSWAQVERGHHQNEGHTSGIYNRNYRILTTYDSTYDSKLLDKYLTKQHHKVCFYCINFFFENTGVQLFSTVLMTVFNCYSFVVGLTSESIMPQALFFFLKIVLTIRVL